MGFLQNRLIYFRELAPKQTITMNLRAFLRTDPLLQPCFMHLDARVSSFFVPMEMIWTRWNEFIAQSIRNGSTIATVPTIKESNIIKALGAWLNVPANEGDEFSHDFYTINSMTQTPVVKYYKFVTPQIKNLLSVLSALGYRLSGGVDITPGTPSTGHEGSEFSALPLLAWSKCWFDYFRIDERDSFPYEPDQGNLSVADMTSIFTRINSLPIAFAKDYFCHNETPDAAGYTNFHATNAEARPHISTTDLNELGTDSSRNSTGLSQSLNTLNGSGSSTPANNVGLSPSLITRASGSTVDQSALTDLALSQLGRVTDWVKRISVSGMSAFKRILNEYGVSTTDTPTTKVAEFLGDYIFNLNGEEITQTSEGIENLGTQLTASIKGSGNVYLRYTAEKFGYLMMFMNIRPKTEFVEGRPRHVSHIKPLNFWHADFDNFGYQATKMSELICPLTKNYDNGSGDQNTPTFLSDYRNAWNNGEAVEGVLPTYAEYKVGNSMVSGDFMRYTLRNVNERYNLARYLRPTVNGSSQLPSSGELLKLTNYWSQPSDYNRIFADGTAYDPFICHLDFVASVDAPMRGLFDLPGDWNCATNGNGVRGTSNPDKFAHI